MGPTLTTRPLHFLFPLASEAQGRPEAFTLMGEAPGAGERSSAAQVHPQNKEVDERYRQAALVCLVQE